VNSNRPLPNRVDPFGELQATPERGALMGNRGGRFHRDDRTLGQRRWTNRTWIACLTAFKGRKRPVWGRSYTELFFLDEPTAFAAGHRPCFECRRADALRFRDALGGKPSAGEMDLRLHAERLEGRRQRRRHLKLETLPDGAFVAISGAAYAVRQDHMLPWSFAGYGAAVSRPRGIVEVLTPPSILAALASGYPARFGSGVSVQTTTA
jgi:hypothetical protein